MVRCRMRLVLPLVQVALAVALMTSNFLRPFSVENPAWTKPDRQFCLGLNAPATLLAEIPVRFANRWFREYYPLDVVVDSVIYFLLIGILWYGVAIEIGGNGRSVLAPMTRMRRMSDTLAVIFGAMLGVLGLLGTRQVGGTVAYVRLVGMPYLIWAGTIMGFYGRDLWVSFGGAQKRAAR
jgi:hypothetical protein